MLNLLPGRVNAISACIYCAMMRRVRWPKVGNNETQTAAKTVMDVVAGDRAAGAAALACRAAIPLAGAGERRRARAEEEHSDHDGQTILPGFRQRFDQRLFVLQLESHSFRQQSRSDSG